MPSRLLDMRECADPAFRDIHAGMRALDLARQPAWFRPLLERSRRLRAMTGFDHWSRAWEYPWAVIEAGLVPAAGPGAGDPPGAAAPPVRPTRLRVLDVGGGGSPFGPWLAARGHEVHVADPSLDQGRDFAWDPGRSVYRNARSAAKRAAFALLGIRSLWGLPGGARNGGDPSGSAGRGTTGTLRYHAFGAQALRFPDAQFDRVFCLSVIEHIPHDLWPACVREFERVLRAGGRLVITMDMETHEADARLPMRLVEASTLRLMGDPRYPVPLDPGEAQRRHPGNWYETMGLVWEK
jgi:SAM-dependent methyltransferase